MKLYLQGIFHRSDYDRLAKYPEQYAGNVKIKHNVAVITLGFTATEPRLVELLDGFGSIAVDFFDHPTIWRATSRKAYDFEDWTGVRIYKLKNFGSFVFDPQLVHSDLDNLISESKSTVGTHKHRHPLFSFFAPTRSNMQRFPVNNVFR